MNTTPPAHKTAMSESDNNRLMGTGVIIGLILIGLFSFSALITLAGYSGDLEDKNNGRAHVLSNSAIGFAGLRLLLEETGQNVKLDPEPTRTGQTNTLRLLTLNSAYQTDELSEIGDTTPALIILPKWTVFPIAKSPGWVEHSSVKPLQDPDTLASNLKDLIGDVKIKQAKARNNINDISLRLTNNGSVYNLPIRRLQSFGLSDKTADDTVKIIPLITLENENEFVLAQLNGTNTYILSDPDFLNTQSLVKKQGARFALDLLSFVQSKTSTIGYTFDLSLHGLGGRQNMVKLFTRPPFLSLTLLLIVLVALLGWQAFIRFGDPQAGPVKYLEGDLQMGPQSLAKTTAEVLAITHRESDLMPAYSHQIRQQALSVLGLTGRNSSEHIKALEHREINKHIKPNFETLNKKANAVTHRDDIVALAKALQKWKKDIIT